jgi:FdrA protein
MMTSRGLTVASNTDISKQPWFPGATNGHICLDVGREPFTQRDPYYHPMASFDARRIQLEHDAKDKETAVILFDVVLGYGPHPSLADVISPSIAAVRDNLAKDGRNISFVASVLATDQDVQDRLEQVRQLETIGVVVAPSTTQAANVAIEIVRRVPDTTTHDQRPFEPPA